MSKRLAALAGAGFMLFIAVAPVLAANRPVTIGDNFYSPKEITVTKGDKITWTYPNSGTTSHSVTARPSQAESFDSSASPACPPTCLQPGESFAHTFNKVGTFIYYCKVHGTPSGNYSDCAMCGKVTVLSAS